MASRYREWLQRRRRTWREKRKEEQTFLLVGFGECLWRRCVSGLGSTGVGMNMRSLGGRRGPVYSLTATGALLSF